MRPFPYLGTARRVLASRLQQLASTLEDLGERLRDAVGQAVGQTVGGSVRDALHELLADRPPLAPAPRHFSPSRDAQSPLWDQPDRCERDPWLNESQERIEDEDLDPYPTPEFKKPVPRRWVPALAAGLQTAAWWLRRRVGGHPVLAAVGVGLLAVVATWACSPLVVPCLDLMSLASTVQAGAQLAGAL